MIYNIFYINVVSEKAWFKKSQSQSFWWFTCVLPMMMGSPVCVMKQLMLIFSSKLRAAIFLQRIIILLFILFLDVFCPKTLLPALTMFTPATTDWLYLTLINMRTLTQGDYELFHWLRTIYRSLKKCYQQHPLPTMVFTV